MVLFRGIIGAATVCGATGITLARMGKFGTKTIDLTETEEVGYLSVEKKNLLVYDYVSYWIDYKDMHVPCFRKRVFSIKPVEVVQEYNIFS